MNYIALYVLETLRLENYCFESKSLNRIQTEYASQKTYIL
jgi:hypothetical protein